MEYLDGEPLAARIRRGPLRWSEAFPILDQTLRALRAAHDRGFVHRDLKPDNIWLQPSDGRVAVKLLDFGIAKLLGEESLSDPALTLAYGRIMTPEYAAPEQVRGEPVTTATDIYSLGAVLYQLLTGERAHRFEKRTAAEIERVVCDTDPVAPSLAMRSGRTGAVTSSWPRALSGDLDTIVLAALQKEPARRYVSAEAMLDDLRRLRTGRPLLARPDSLRYRWGKFIGRNRAGVAAASIVALVLAGGVFATAWQARAAHLEAARADQVKGFLRRIPTSRAERT
jgi:serine/threonine-protein kinase